MIPRRNTYPGPCATCTTRVGAHAGYLVRTADKWGVVCIHCHSNPRLPARAAFTPPTGPVQVVASFAQGWCSFRPENVTGELAAHVFAALDGAPYDKASKQRRCRLQIATVIVARLQAIEGLRVVIEPELAAALQALAAQASTEHAAADERAAQVDARLRDRGLALFPFQRVGASWLAPRDGAILADDMGCIDGAALVHVNRGGKGFTISLAKLHHRFNRLGTSRKRWDPSIPTTIRALCNGTFRQHPIKAVLHKGTQPVWLLRLASGKQVRLTPDHEIARTDGTWTPAAQLKRGDLVLSNGQWVDRDGYVRVSGHADHHRRTTGGVYEHILVAERMLGRAIARTECVHHRNGIKHDNRPENLEVMPLAEHARMHGRAGGFLRLHGSGDGRVMFVPHVDEVVEIRPDGVATVYDVVCDDPFRNFVANGIVVHNCGKTIQALCAAPEGAPVIVVCPSVAKGVWLREAHKWRPDLTPVVLSGRASFRWPRAGEMIVANYDILSTDRAHCTRCEGSGTVTTTTGKTKGCDCVVLLDPPLGCVLIADEAHAIKNTKAARTQKFRAITKRIRAAHGRVWLITATPILNRPMELWALLSTISRAKQAFGSWQAFVATFGGKEGRYGVEFDAKKINVARVTARLQEVMLRRMKTDVLKELPAKTIEILDVELDTTALRNLDAVVRELAAQGIDLHKALRAARTNQGTELKEIARARAILAMGKVAAALDLVGEIEEAGEPLVVFSAHRGPVDILGAREGWAAITGDTTPAERTQIEEAFQAGKLRGVAGTIAAAGVAITLTRAAAALFIDPAWTPALNAQAEDRIYRIGQARPVTVTYLRVAHAVDEAVFACLDIKRAIITNTVDAAAKEQAS